MAKMDLDEGVMEGYDEEEGKPFSLILNRYARIYGRTLDIKRQSTRKEEKG